MLAVDIGDQREQYHECTTYFGSKCYCARSILQPRYNVTDEEDQPLLGSIIVEALRNILLSVKNVV
jgi:hypothetical protein